MQAAIPVIMQEHHRVTATPVMQGITMERLIIQISAIPRTVQHVIRATAGKVQVLHIRA